MPRMVWRAIDGGDVAWVGAEGMREIERLMVGESGVGGSTALPGAIGHRSRAMATAAATTQGQGRSAWII